MIAKMAGAKPKVAVIGAGPGGIAMGIQLAEVVSTSRSSTAATDSAALAKQHLSRRRVRRAVAPLLVLLRAEPALEQDLRQPAGDPRLPEQGRRRQRLGDHLVARSRVTTLRWSDTERRWTLETEDGARYQFDIVVTAVGMLDIPNIPDIPGAAGLAAGRSIRRIGITRNRLRVSGSRRSEQAPAPSNTCRRSLRTPLI